MSEQTYLGHALKTRFEDRDNDARDEIESVGEELYNNPDAQHRARENFLSSIEKDVESLANDMSDDEFHRANDIIDRVMGGNMPANEKVSISEPTMKYIETKIAADSSRAWFGEVELGITEAEQY